MIYDALKTLQKVAYVLRVFAIVMECVLCPHLRRLDMNAIAMA